MTALDINDIKPEIWVSDSDKNLLENERTKGWKIIAFSPADHIRRNAGALKIMKPLQSC